MFEQTFVGTAKTHKTWSVFVTFGGQVAVILVIILIPLIYTDTLPRAQLTSFLVAPPPPPEGWAPCGDWLCHARHVSFPP